MESESAVLIVDREAEPMRRGSVVMTRAHQADIDTGKHSQAARRR